MSLWMQQRHCSSCFARGKSLVECKTCHCSAHCGTPACAAQFVEEHSSRVCEAYATHYCAYVMALQQGTPLMVASKSRAPVYGLPVTWSAYFADKLTDFEVDEALLEFPPVMVSVP